MRLCASDSDLISLNETKLNEIKTLFFSKNINYNFVFKSSETDKTNGGGVAIIIKKTINYSEMDSQFVNEIFGLNISTNKLNFAFISYYCPPDNVDLLKNIVNYNKNYINCGDLSSKSISFGGNLSNSNGELLVILMAET